MSAVQRERLPRQENMQQRKPTLTGGLAPGLCVKCSAVCPRIGNPLFLIARVMQTSLSLCRKEGATCWI